MTFNSFDKIHLLYDFMDKYILKDYQIALKILQKNLLINKSDKIIDIGGGTGYIARNLLNKSRNITILDPSFKMLKKSNKKIDLIQADGANMPIIKNRFDIVILINTLHHIEESDQFKTLQEIFRILKNNGKFFILDLHFPLNFFNNLFKKFEEFLLGPTNHLTCLQVIEYFKKIGFRDINYKFVDKKSYRYIIIAKK